MPFDNLSPSQRALRTGLRERLAQLPVRVSEILHATYSGPKDPRADVENLLLYNVDQGGELPRGSPRREEPACRHGAWRPLRAR